MSCLILKLYKQLNFGFLNFRRKRSFPINSFLPPNFSVTLWGPLLIQVRSNHPAFPSILVQRIITFLLSESPAPDTHSDGVQADGSDILFDMCLARWAYWVIDSSDNDEGFDVDFKRDVAVTLLNALGPKSMDTSRNKMACVPLLCPLRCPLNLYPHRQSHRIVASNLHR